MNPCTKPRQPREPVWLDLEGASDFVGWPEFVLVRAVDSGQLRAACLGPEMRFHVNWLAAWAAAHRRELDRLDEPALVERVEGLGWRGAR